MKITKELLDKLNNTDISKREYDGIISAIDGRVEFVWTELLKISNRKLKWYAFDNDIELGDGDGSTGGQFDPIQYKEWISIIGEFSGKSDDYYKYDDGFPTRFLWMEDDDWKKEVLINIGESVAKTKLDKENKKKELEEKEKIRTEMIKVIKSKLTKEELKYIEFK